MSERELHGRSLGSPQRLKDPRQARPLSVSPPHDSSRIFTVLCSTHTGPKSGDDPLPAAIVVVVSRTVRTQGEALSLRRAEATSRLWDLEHQKHAQGRLLWVEASPRWSHHRLWFLGSRQCQSPGKWFQRGQRSTHRDCAGPGRAGAGSRSSAVSGRGFWRLGKDRLWEGAGRRPGQGKQRAEAWCSCHVAVSPAGPGPRRQM